jgi:hypothetical protein
VLFPSIASTNSSTLNSEVLGALADADVADRELLLRADAEDDAALGGAVELGQHDAGEGQRLLEHRGLLRRVLAVGRVEDEQRLVRRAVEGLVAIVRAIFFSSSIRLALVWRRPAVSARTTSAPTSFAFWIASKITAPGLAPSFPLTTSQPTRLPHTTSC